MAGDPWWFEVYADAERQFRWRLKAPNGEIVADSSEGYTRKRDCYLAIGRVRQELNRAETIEV